jgi:hypothetical protein
MRIRVFLKTTKTDAVLAASYRFNTAAGCHVPQILRLASWSRQSRELTSFTDNLAGANVDYLAHTVSAVTGEDYARVRSYIDELANDETVKATPAALSAAASDGTQSRASKNPGVVSETGADKGLGSVTLCAALLRNRSEDDPGQHFGADINPSAGFLLDGGYREVGKILHGELTFGAIVLGDNAHITSELSTFSARPRISLLQGTTGKSRYQAAKS